VHARITDHLTFQSTQRELNPHFLHGKQVGFRYIMGACAVRLRMVQLSKSTNRQKSTGWDSNPRCRITKAVSSPLNDQCGAE
jgi:hypothetical protein